jgi:hypothetical protein
MKANENSVTNRQNFENFALYVKFEIKCKFEQNIYLSFSVDFKTQLEKFYKQTINNNFLVEILVKETENILFIDFFDIVDNIEKYNTKYYNIQQKFDTLISLIDSENSLDIETLNTIILKFENCKKILY